MLPRGNVHVVREMEKFSEFELTEQQLNRPKSALFLDI